MPIEAEAGSRRRFGFGSLGQSTVAVLAWQIIRILVLAVWLIAMARLLGANGLGKFVGVAGMATAIGGLAGAGLGLLMYRDVVRDAACFARRWRQASRATWVTGAVMALIFVPMARAVFDDVPIGMLLAIAVSELLFTPLVALAAFAFAAHHRMGWSSALPAGLGLARLVALWVLWKSAGSEANVAQYAVLYSVSSIGVALAALWLVRVLLRPGAEHAGVSLVDIRQGLGFSAVWASSTALASIDKAMVLRLGGDAIAGQYASVYRFATIMAMPIDALAMAALPRLFGAPDPASRHPRLIPSLIACVLCYGLFAGALLWSAAGFLPALLGESFAPTVDVARGMALLVPAYGMRILATNLLMAMDRKRERFVIEMVGLLCLGAFAAIWIPHEGLGGAVKMVVLSEVFLATAAWATIVTIKSRRSGK